MRHLHPSFVVLVCIAPLALTTGCAAVKSASAIREPLAVPPAPPRVIIPAPLPAPQDTPVVEPEPVPPLPRVSRQLRETQRSEPKSPSEHTAPGPTEAESVVKSPVPAVAPAPELRTGETPDDAKATRLVRDTLERAGRTLGGIDYRALPQPSQLQYDMAKQFIEQSEEALKARNYTAAQLMAEKAETIAKELSGR
jgi:hypothetical protein